MTSKHEELIHNIQKRIKGGDAVHQACEHEGISKSHYYTLLKKHNTVGAKKINTPPPTLEEKQRVVNAVDVIRKKDTLNIKDATEKYGIHFSTYYNYKKELKNTNKTQKVKTTKNNIQKLPVHTIEYVEKNSSKEKPIQTKKTKDEELIMMIGSPQTLLNFVKKMRGENG